MDLNAAPSEEPSGDDAAPTGTDPVVYVYCLGNASALTGLAVQGIDDGRAVELVTYGSIGAVVSTVAADEFCGADAETRMKDLAWMAPRACRHEEVVERALLASPVVPMRFATLFSSPARLTAWLTRHEAAIRAALNRFATHEEYAVKGRLDRSRAEAPVLAAALARGVSGNSPGARYLQEKRVRANIGHEISTWVRERCREIAAALSEYAVELRDRGVGSAEASGAESPIFNWAFLVPVAQVVAFQARVEAFHTELAERGLSVEWSGPWPSYSFTPTLDANGEGSFTTAV